MAVGNYTYSELLNEVLDSARRSNITNVITARIPLNRGARRLLEEIDLRSTKRKSVLGTDLFDDIYSYPSPTDLKGSAIIDFDPQVNRDRTFRIELVTEQEFEQKKRVRNNIVALATDELVPRILFSGNVDDTILVTATLDSTTAEGTWTAFSDATNIQNDSANFVKGGGAISYDLTGSGVEAGIQNTTIPQFDITEFTNQGQIFVWAYINSITNLTNFIIRIGNDLTTNYYTQTITQTNEATSFVNGWNLLRFDFASMTLNGTVTATEVDSIRIYMTKTSGKSDDGYRFDHVELHTGQIHDIIYYSRFAWQSSGGTFLEDSTADTDLINAETDEVDGFIFRMKMELFRELRRFDLVKDAKQEYLEWKRDYQRRNPSERIQRERLYYNSTLYNRRF